MENHFFCQNISAAFAGKFYQTFEHTTAAWNDTQLLFSALCLQHYDCIDFFISQKWKRLSFCHDRRENDRCDFTLKIAFNVFAFFFIHLLEIRDADIIFFQFFHDFIVNDISATVQFSDFRKDLFDLLLRCKICFIITDIFLKKHLIYERSHTHHKKFIKIALIDCCKIQSFTERHFFIFRLFQNTFIKFQPRQFPVHIYFSHLLFCPPQ